MPNTGNPSEQPFQQFRRDEDDFEALYANNIQLQPSEWDIKAIFGELDFTDEGKPFVQQHTSIAIPWLQAKIFLYFLALQVGAHELQHGKIMIPASVLPPKPPLPEGELASDPLAMAVHSHAQKMWDMFILK